MNNLKLLAELLYLRLDWYLDISTEKDRAIYSHVWDLILTMLTDLGDHWYWAFKTAIQSYRAVSAREFCNYMELGAYQKARNDWGSSKVEVLDERKRVNFRAMDVATYVSNTSL